MISIGIFWFILIVVAAGGLGLLAGGLMRTSSEADHRQTVAHDDLWEEAAQEARRERDDNQKALGRAAEALAWLASEAPGLDAALRYPEDPADIIMQVEAIREGMAHVHNTEVWERFVAGESQ